MTNTTHQYQLPHHNEGEHYHKGRTTKDEQMAIQQRTQNVTTSEE